MRKYLLVSLYAFVCLCLSFIQLYAQPISVIPNPSAPDIFNCAGNGPLSGYSGSPMVLNNSLVLEYNPSGTSDLSQFLVQQLAVYNGGNSLQLIPNPDAGEGVYYGQSKVVFDGKLFFIYLAAGGGQKLASFDGSAVTAYPNPDASGSGVIGAFRILDNKLYMAYQNASVVTQLARFNGSGITLIPNPDNSANGYFNNYSVVFGNKIVSRYVTAAGPKKLATFDGTQWTILPNPDNSVPGVQPIFPAEYKGKLYFKYYSATGQYQYLQYDGSSNPSLIANPQNSSMNTGGVTGNFPIVYNDTLFLQYYDVNNVYRLAKFDGNSISLVANADATTYGYWYTPVVYHNKLYIMYLPADGTRHLAQYQPAINGLSVIPNPDAGQGYWEMPIVYGDKLYIKYNNAQNVFQLAAFDGDAIQLIANPPGSYNTTGKSGYMGQPIVWNDVLYIQMGGVPYGCAGNLARVIAAGNSICPGGNTSFLSNISGAAYQWQVDNGNGTFTNLTNTQPYSNVSTNTLTITAAASSLYGYKYRCVVNGNTYSQTYTLKFTSNWTGAVNTAWETGGNWDCGTVPDANTDVYIGISQSNQPVISSNRSIRSIHLQNGMVVKLGANGQLNITGK